MASSNSTSTSVASHTDSQYRALAQGSHGHAPITIASILIGISTVCIALRVYSRAIHISLTGVDDVMIVVTFLFLVAYTTVSLVGATRYEKALMATDNEQFGTLFSQYLQVGIWSGAMFLITGSVTKLSLLFLYRRILGKQRFTRLIEVIIGVTILYCITFVTVTFTQCRPYSYIYLSFLPGEHKGSCIRPRNYLMPQAIIDMVLNLVILLLPVRIIYILVAPKSVKVVLSALFGIGFLGFAAGILRLYCLYRIFWTVATPPWQLSDYWVWSLLELNLGVICASLPACRNLFATWARTYIPKAHIKSHIRSRRRTAETLHRPEQEHDQSSELRPEDRSETRPYHDRDSRYMNNSMEVPMSEVGIAF